MRRNIDLLMLLKHYVQLIKVAHSFCLHVMPVLSTLIGY